MYDLRLASWQVGPACRGRSAKIEIRRPSEKWLWLQPGTHLDKVGKSPFSWNAPGCSQRHFLFG